MITMIDWHQTPDFNNLMKDKELPVEVDEDIYESFLCCVPPIYTENGFLCSEAVKHINGKAVYNSFTEKAGKYYYNGLITCKNEVA